MKKFNLFCGIASIIVLASCSSKPYEVSRETEINVPTNFVYTQIINHKNRGNWSPWENKDPDMTKNYEGPESGVGAIYKWSGNDDVGTGTLEIIEARENEYIKSKLTFTEPWESEDIVEWELESTENGTKATWKTSGELPGMAAMFMGQTMDEMLGPDFEKGLTDLKSYCEANYSQPEQSESTEEKTISIEELPETIKSQLTKENNIEILEAEETKDTEGNTIYEVEYKMGETIVEMRFDAEGNQLPGEDDDETDDMEDEDEEEDEDEMDDNEEEV